jgi:hypothetical protein
MSYHEYVTSRDIAAHDYPFYALIMAAMRKADSVNVMTLKYAFPETWNELMQRYNTFDGVLAGELHDRTI